MKLVSVIIPAYNEETVIGDCLKSILSQNYKHLEVILVDDGSGDKTIKIAKKFKLKILTQKHLGPGSARNFGVKEAKGEILVFVDCDMTFDKNFVGDLIKPILNGETIGTFSKNELVKNSNNPWSVCWNINRNAPKEKMLPEGYPDEAPVFRAILKKEFEKVGGFETTGDYTDDWSLFQKIGKKSTAAEGAFYYHSNPSGLVEIWKQARWIGKNKFISGNFPRRIKSLFFYNPLSSFFVAITKTALNFNLRFFIFKMVYDFAVFISVVNAIFGNRNLSK